MLCCSVYTHMSVGACFFVRSLNPLIRLIMPFLLSFFPSILYPPFPFSFILP